MDTRHLDMRIFIFYKVQKGKVIVDIANRHYGRTPRQVVLRFLSLYSNVFTIPKTSHPERARENSQSVGNDWSLTDKYI